MLLADTLVLELKANVTLATAQSCNMDLQKRKGGTDSLLGNFNPLPKFQGYQFPSSRDVI